MDKLSPEESALLPAFVIGPVTRMGERVAAAEARFSAEISALKEDTRTIRTAVHGINNSLHVAGIAERHAAVELAKLSEKLSASTELLTTKMGAQTDQLGDLAGKVDTLSIAKHQIEGGWWALVKATAILSAVSTIIGAAIATVWWVIQHVHG